MKVFVLSINVTTLSSFPTLDNKKLTGWYCIKKLALAAVGDGNQSRKVCRTCSFQHTENKELEIF